MEIYPILLYGSIGAILAFGLIIAALSASRFESHGLSLPIRYALPLIIAALAISVLSSNRDLAEARQLLTTGQVKGIVASNATRIVSLFILVVGLSSICRSLFEETRIDKGGKLLIGSFLAYWVGAVFIPMLFSSHPDPSHEYFYLAILGTALLLQDEAGTKKSLLLIRDALFVFCVFSLVIAAIKPSMALDLEYSQGLIPSLPRFAGLSQHAISMGAFAYVLLAFAIGMPYRKTGVNIIAVFVSVLIIFWSQSKVIWICSLVSFCSYYLTATLAPNIRQALFGGSLNRKFVLNRDLALLVTSVLSAGLIAIFLDTSSILQKFLISDVAGNLSSLTGRDLIWKVALDEWSLSPLFGYGLGVFEIDHRLVIGLPHATHGHNQLIDVLARSGLVGMAGFLLHLFVLARITWSVLPLAPLGYFLLTLLVSLSISEVPFNIARHGASVIPFVSFLLFLRWSIFKVEADLK
ncbi:O-antigen ligase family protein [Aquabacterium lacunae]|uniref:O-antigen ligase family protein n=1 Tax=Aquabacterium lacunae TaxID=2528630 RepID=A0A4Q9GXG4_9BURK|nr:O-antigen ligase family protein [Aquabacterium lacunae]TBO28312.1 O-antigen ligase family protein [Aquabacterium lacunae]